MTERYGKHVGKAFMKISKIVLFDFTGNKSFAFESLSNFKFREHYSCSALGSI